MSRLEEIVKRSSWDSPTPTVGLNLPATGIVLPSQRLLSSRAGCQLGRY